MSMWRLPRAISRQCHAESWLNSNSHYALQPLHRMDFPVDFTRIEPERRGVTRPTVTPDAKMRIADG